MAPNLGVITTEELRDAVADGRPVVVLVPVGSVEPHGPHLPLATDTLISEEVAARAAPSLEEQGMYAFVAPSIPYGVTRFAEGFAGAISVPPDVLTAFLAAIVDGYLRTGAAHVCLVNNHLEPEHDAAVRAAITGAPRGSASVACPLTRRWARTLSDEFKSGACHAGRYETSLILAHSDPIRPLEVIEGTSGSLPPLGVSLSAGIKAGKTSFRAMGLERAYTGAPAEASAEEGEEMLSRLATMVVTEVTEALAARAAGETDEKTR